MGQFLPIGLTVSEAVTNTAGDITAPDTGGADANALLTNIGTRTVYVLVNSPVTVTAGNGIPIPAGTSLLVSIGQAGVIQHISVEASGSTLYVTSGYGESPVVDPSYSPQEYLVSATIPMTSLFQLRGADLQITTDQIFTKKFQGSKYKITEILAARVSGAASVACAGGIYSAAAKGGSAIVAAGQDWVSLASGVIVKATLAALTNTDILTTTPYLSLTTGSTAACTADLFIMGYPLDDA